MCNLVNKSRKKLGHKIRCTVESTAGSVGNLRSIAAKELEIAIVQSDWQFHAYKGTSVFKEIGAQPALRFVGGLHSDAFQIVSRKEKGIRSWADLKGKTVNTGNVGSGTEATIYMAMKRYPLEPKTFFGQETKLTSREQAQAMCDGKIDAFIYPTGITAASITEATNTCSTNIANWNDDVTKGILKQFSYFTAVNIPANTYRGVDYEVKSWGMPATVVSTTRLSDDVIYILLKAVIDNFADFKKQSTLYAALERKAIPFTGKSIPYHGGAERYYKETGLIK